MRSETYWASSLAAAVNRLGGVLVSLSLVLAVQVAAALGLYEDQAMLGHELEHVPHRKCSVRVLSVCWHDPCPPLRPRIRR
ncbi:MAG: hypothetical protein WKF73_07685 [Nocardioidaceae bacterium]